MVVIISGVIVMKHYEESIHPAALLQLQRRLHTDSAAQPAGFTAQNELISVALAWMKLCHKVTNLSSRV